MTYLVLARRWIGWKGEGDTRIRQLLFGFWIYIFLFLCISPEGKKSKSSATVISGFHSFTFLFFISLYRKNFTRRHSYQQPTFPFLKKRGEKGGEFEKESTVNRFERVTYFCYFLVLWEFYRFKCWDDGDNVIGRCKKKYDFKIFWFRQA